MKKYIAIVELPDDAEEWGGCQWKIDDVGGIRYREDENAWYHYTDIDVDGIELRPLPEKKKGNTYKYYPAYTLGWNECLTEITGETK